MTTSGFMGFVGVSTSQSSIRKVFPAWAHLLCLPTDRLIGHDVPLDAGRDVYRSLVSRAAADDNEYGALVTTHKMAVFEHAADLFDNLDELAVMFGELSSVYKRGGRLLGAAKDPVTVRLALDDFLPADHFRATGGDAVVLGAGGSGNALSYNLAVRDDCPGTIHVVARHRDSAARARELHERVGIEMSRLRYVVADTAGQASNLVSSVPAGSLIVNATGMGKDRPGSPLSDSVMFPRRSVVWEFNYRGTLEFLHQAERQEVARELRIEDGWRYFVHGWSQVLGDVFDMPMPRETVDRLAAAAAAARWQR